MQGKLVLGFNSECVSYLVYYGTFFTKCNSYFIAKCDKILSQNAWSLSLQNVVVTTKCDVYYKMRLCIELKQKNIGFRRLWKYAQQYKKIPIK